MSKIALPDNAYEGYLDVKIPNQVKGLLRKRKSWNQRWVKIDSMKDEGHCVTIHIFTSEAASRSQPEKHFLVTSLSPENTVVFRSRSRTHQYTFSIAQGEQAVLHLAGCSESHSQQWMAEIRCRLWPEIPVTQVEKVLSKAYDVSIVDTDSSSKAGGLGVYGYMAISRDRLTVSHPQSGRIMMEWPLHLVQNVHLKTQKNKDDQDRVMSIVSGGRAPWQEKTEITFFSYNCVDIVNEVKAVLRPCIIHERRRSCSLNNCDLLQRELNTVSHQKECEDRQRPVTSCGFQYPCYPPVDTRRKCFSSADESDRDLPSGGINISRPKDRDQTHRSRSDTHLNWTETDEKHSNRWQDHFGKPINNAKFYISTKSIEDDLDRQQDENETVFYKDRCSTISNESLDYSISSSSSSSHLRTSSFDIDSEGTSSEHFSPSPSQPREVIKGLNNDLSESEQESVPVSDSTDDEMTSEEVNHAVQHTRMHCEKRMSVISEHSTDTCDGACTTSRRSSAASVSSSHTYVVTPTSSKRPSQTSEKLYEDISEFQNQSDRNKTSQRPSQDSETLHNYTNDIQCTTSRNNAVINRLVTAPQRPSSLDLERQSRIIGEEYRFSSSSESFYSPLETPSDDFCIYRTPSSSISSTLSQSSTEGERSSWFKNIFNKKSKKTSSHNNVNQNKIPRRNKKTNRGLSKLTSESSSQISDCSTEEESFNGDISSYVNGGKASFPFCPFPQLASPTKSEEYCSYSELFGIDFQRPVRRTQSCLLERPPPVDLRVQSMLDNIVFTERKHRKFKAWLEEKTGPQKNQSSLLKCKNPDNIETFKAHVDLHLGSTLFSDTAESPSPSSNEPEELHSDYMTMNPLDNAPMDPATYVNMEPLSDTSSIVQSSQVQLAPPTENIPNTASSIMPPRDQPNPDYMVMK